MFVFACRNLIYNERVTHQADRLARVPTGRQEPRSGIIISRKRLVLMPNYSAKVKEGRLSLNYSATARNKARGYSRATLCLQSTIANLQRVATRTSVREARRPQSKAIYVPHAASIQSWSQLATAISFWFPPVFQRATAFRRSRPAR